MYRRLRFLTQPITYFYFISLVVLIAVIYVAASGADSLNEEFRKGRRLRIIAVSVVETRIGIFYILPNGELRSIGYQADSVTDPLYGLVMITSDDRASEILFQGSDGWDSGQISKIRIRYECLSGKRC